MSIRETDSQRLIALPLWQLILVVVGLPAVYMINSLMPWSIGLLRQHDHSFFFQFWCSIALLHWSSVILVIILLKRNGAGLANLGLHLSPLRISFMLGIPVVIGMTLIILNSLGLDHASKTQDVVSPATIGEKSFWIFMSFTAGFCEELVYRGFAIRALQSHNMRTWLAVGIATLSFVLMHGVSVLSVIPFFIIYIGGLIFSVLFLWRRSPVPGIYLHTLFDLMSIR